MKKSFNKKCSNEKYQKLSTNLKHIRVKTKCEKLITNIKIMKKSKKYQKLSTILKLLSVKTFPETDESSNYEENGNNLKNYT